MEIMGSLKVSDLVTALLTNSAHLTYTLITPFRNWKNLLAIQPLLVHNDGHETFWIAKETI